MDAGDVRPWRRVAVALLVALALMPPSTLVEAAQGPEAPGSEAPAHPMPPAGQATSESAAADPVRALSLAETIRLARERSPLIRARELQVEAAELDVRRVEDILQLPQIGLEGRTGLVPEARGTILDSPDDQNDLDGFGPFIQLDVGLTMPVYGFGRLSNLREAARSGLNARAAQRDATADELAVQAARAYWGLVAAGDAVEVAGELRSEYQEILDELEDKLAADEIDNTDAFEVQAFRYDIEQTWRDAGSDLHRARVALAELLGLDPDAELGATGEPTPELGLGEDAGAELVRRAARNHPQLRALEAAVAALDARMGYEKSERGPLFALGGLFGFAHAGNRTDQTNPFVYDPWNRLTVGAALGFRWDLNFARHSLEIAQARIERDATAAQARALRGKVSLDVRQAHRRVADNYELLRVARETRRVTRRWLRVAADNWDLGIGEAETLLKAYRQDYRLQGVVVERQYELNVSLSQLAAAVGDFDLYLDWFRDGHVALD